MLKKYIKPVYAHCDVPCGIYETDTMRHAADTCLRMVEKIEALGELDSPDKWNNFVRMVATKEEHAQKVKDQVYLLWSDFFKPEHLNNHENLHDLMWQAAKQAGVVKHSVNKEVCQVLLHRVEAVDELFKQVSSGN
jgi:nickel superoxide dismutase